MHEKHLYDYAVIRVVPKVEREEFVNVGLMLLCKRQKYLRIAYQIPTEKIISFCFFIGLNSNKIKFHPTFLDFVPLKLKNPTLIDVLVIFIIYF